MRQVNGLFSLFVKLSSALFIYLSSAVLTEKNSKKGRVELRTSEIVNKTKNLVKPKCHDFDIFKDNF